MSCWLLSESMRNERMKLGEEGGNDQWSAPLFTLREPGSGTILFAPRFADPAGQKPNTLHPDLVNQ